MKMQIIDCLSDLVKEKFGADKWEKILELSDMGKGSNSFRYFVGFDIMDTKAMEIVTNTCQVLGITAEQAADAFGDYWINVYAPRVFPKYYNIYKTAKDFITGMDQIHKEVTENLENAHPPRFDVTDVNEKTIRVHYKSSRNMIGFYIGLVKGIGRYFNTALSIKKISEQIVEITFP